MVPCGSTSSPRGKATNRVSTGKPSMRVGRVPSGPWYEHRGPLRRCRQLQIDIHELRTTRAAGTDSGARIRLPMLT